MSHEAMNYRTRDNTLTLVGSLRGVKTQCFLGEQWNTDASRILWCIPSMRMEQLQLVLMRMKNRVMEHFSTLYSCENRLRLRFDYHFPICISLELNVWLQAYPREEEVKFTPDSMPKEKAPGSDGQTEEILQYHWDTC